MHVRGLAINLRHYTPRSSLFFVVQHRNHGRLYAPPPPLQKYPPMSFPREARDTVIMTAKGSGGRPGLRATVPSNTQLLPIVPSGTLSHSRALHCTSGARLLHAPQALSPVRGREGRCSGTSCVGSPLTA